MHAGLVYFGKNPAFEYGAAEGMEAKLLRFTDAEEVTGQTAVKEMELGRFDDLLFA